MQSEIQFSGINETLFYLKNYEKELFNEFKKKLGDAAKPLADLVGSQFPTSTPLKNWHTTGGRKGKSRLPPYNANAARTRVKAISGGTTRRNASGGRGILRIQQNDAGGQVYDSAGRGTYESPNSTFITNLDGKFIPRVETRSRVMFKAVKDNQNMVEAAVIEIVKEVDELTTRRINEKNTR